MHYLAHSFQIPWLYHATVLKGMCQGTCHLGKMLAFNFDLQLPTRWQALASKGLAAVGPMLG